MLQISNKISQLDYKRNLDLDELLAMMFQENNFLTIQGMIYIKPFDQLDLTVEVITIFLQKIFP